jgi:hypothetical protein
VVARSPVTGRKAAGKHVRRADRQSGIPGDQFQVELRGHQYFVVDGRSRMTFGGPYPGRIVAQRKADALNQSLGW